MHKQFADSTVNHFIQNQPKIGILPNLQSAHHEYISKKFLPHAQNIVDKITGGSAGSGGSIHTGGGLGALVPQDAVGMYHNLLMMSPGEFEAYREAATQMLGGVPSKMWGAIEEPNEPLEAEPDEYENVINMPNVHAAARMLEADESSPMGGGFGKALRHIGRKIGSLYKVGRASLNFVDRNRDTLLDIPGIRNYKDQIGSFLDSAKAMDESVNPLVEAAIEAAGSGQTSEEGKRKLKQLATESIDNAIQKHMPEAQKYIDVAKDFSKTIQNPSYNPFANITG